LRFEAERGATPHGRALRELDALATELVGAVAGTSAAEARLEVLSRDRVALTATLTGALPKPAAHGLVRVELVGVPGGLDGELPAVPARDRQAPIALPGPASEELEVTLTLPAGWSVAAAPVAADVQNRLGAVHVTATVSGREVRVVRRIELGTAVVAPADAAAARELLVAWRSPATRDLLLRPPAAPGPATGAAKP
jgi:hypothetical protein